MQTQEVKPTQSTKPTEPQKPTQPAKPVEPEKPTQPEEPSKPEEPTDEIEVIGYDRVTNEDGSQMDIAVLNVNGNEIGVVDVNLDGEADAIICDANQNGVIEEGEMQIVQGKESQCNLSLMPQDSIPSIPRTISPIMSMTLTLAHTYY